MRKTGRILLCVVALTGFWVLGGCSGDAPESTSESTTEPTTGSNTEQNTLTDDELADGWVSLFDGRTLFGWRAANNSD